MGSSSKDILGTWCILMVFSVNEISVDDGVDVLCTIGSSNITSCVQFTAKIKRNNAGKGMEKSKQSSSNS